MHQGNEPQSDCAPRLDLPPPKGLRALHPPNPAFSLEIFLSETTGLNELSVTTETGFAGCIGAMGFFLAMLPTGIYHFSTLWTDSKETC